MLPSCGRFRKWLNSKIRTKKVFAIKTEFDIQLLWCIDKLLCVICIQSVRGKKRKGIPHYIGFIQILYKDITIIGQYFLLPCCYEFWNSSAHSLKKIIYVFELKSFSQKKIYIWTIQWSKIKQNKTDGWRIRRILPEFKKCCILLKILK